MKCDCFFICWKITSFTLKENKRASRESFLPPHPLQEYLMNVTFTFLGETVTFDSRGDPPGRLVSPHLQYLIVSYILLDILTFFLS